MKNVGIINKKQKLKCDTEIKIQSMELATSFNPVPINILPAIIDKCFELFILIILFFLQMKNVCGSLFTFCKKPSYVASRVCDTSK